MAQTRGYISGKFRSCIEKYARSEARLRADAPGGWSRAGFSWLGLVFGLTLALTVLLTACNTRSKPATAVTPPTVTITSPASGHAVQSGLDVPINSTANDGLGILKVELWVDGSLYRLDASPDPEGQRTFVVSQPWHATVLGSHTMVVKAYSKSGQVVESAPVVINVQASAVAVPTDTPTAAMPTVTSGTPPPPGTDTPTPTQPSPAGTDTPVPPAPTGTPTLPPAEPTDTPPPPTDTPTLPPEPTDTPVPTNTPVPEPFAHVWAAVGGESGRLGNPAAGAVLDRWAAEQFFEGGLTYWRNNEFAPANYVYALLYKNGTDETQGTAWLRFEDLWRDGMPQFSCPEAEANGDLGPKRGFGKVWCEEAAVRDGLKLPLVGEQGANAGFQDFEKGTMLWIARLGYVYVLYDDGEWQRFGDQS